MHTNNASIDASFARVVGIMHRLRAPEGCPWDRAQTFESIRAHTLEETYEVLEAISARDFAALREELGDLLLQVLFYSEMAAEQDRFTIADVLNELADKLVRRHPHVFQPGESASSPEAALGRWNAMKAAEKGGSARKSLLDGIPRELPGLAEAAKLGHRAASVGFDWQDSGGVAAKVEEEWGELHAETAANAPSKPRMEEELGDLLFTIANLARHLGLEPESALKHANRKFQRRFQAMEAMLAMQPIPPARPRAEAWEELWQQAKQSEPRA
ncbi:MAG TPA: nucleoside triphosphate pyrophosphohydrolase [Terriglobales bacterium]|nr:nucleoside triphosphate pyrophosphohydrolase [Terriglobales bacterium]